VRALTIPRRYGTTRLMKDQRRAEPERQKASNNHRERQAGPSTG